MRIAFTKCSVDSRLWEYGQPQREHYTILGLIRGPMAPHGEGLVLGLIVTLRSSGLSSPPLQTSPLLLLWLPSLLSSLSLLFLLPPPLLTFLCLYLISFQSDSILNCKGYCAVHPVKTTGQPGPKKTTLPLLAFLASGQYLRKLTHS